MFHVDCFSCTLCGVHLSTGDTAALVSGRVLCGEHYDLDILRYTFDFCMFYNNNNDNDDDE